MASLRKTVEKLATEWRNTDPLLRDEMLRCFKGLHTSARDLINAAPKTLIEAAQGVAMSAFPKILLGASIEDIAIEAASAIPELSPYVRQLLGD